MDKVTEFCEAVWKGDARTIARLVSRIDPNGEDRWGRRPLSMVAQYGDARLARQLLDRGAAVDAGRSLLTPITHAAARGKRDLVELLRGAGATISVLTSVYLGDRRALAKADFVVDEEGTPLLLHAAQSLNVEIVGDLLDRGASVAQTDRFGETALHRVADLRRVDGPRAARVASLLIERGALVDAPNRDAVTPLHQAVRARNLAVVKVLLDRGANPNAADKRGSTPLHRASSSTGAGGTAGIDSAPFVELLLARGADPKKKDRQGRPALSTRSV
jgi:ankyrin repeat protein